MLLVLDEFNTPVFQALMKEQDWTMADVVRSLRPGGPQDTVEISTRCMACKKEYVVKLRQFGDGCSCGGSLDVSDMARWMRAVTCGNLSAARAIKTIRQVKRYQCR